jgi:hypothetical protein
MLNRGYAANTAGIYRNFGGSIIRFCWIVAPSPYFPLLAVGFYLPAALCTLYLETAFPLTCRRRTPPKRQSAGTAVFLHMPRLFAAVHTPLCNIAPCFLHAATFPLTCHRRLTPLGSSQPEYPPHYPSIFSTELTPTAASTRL